MILLFLLILIFTTWLICKDIILKIPSLFIRFAFLVFVGHYMFIIAAVIISSPLSSFVPHILSWVTYSLMGVGLLFIFIKRNELKKDLIVLIKRMQNLRVIDIVGAILLVVVIGAFFNNQIEIKENTLYISTTYIDFHWHMRLIENFANGSNFPPQNESIAGIYHVYHYLWALIPATYMVLGLNLSWAINLYSVLFFMTLLVSGIGVVYEITKSKLSYILVPLFVMTHGSFKFIDYIWRFIVQKQSIEQIFNTSPYFVDYSLRASYGYNGNMFNIYYYIQERQLIIASIGLLLFLYILYHFSVFSKKQLVIIGCIFSLFLQWHLFISTILVIVGILYAVIFTIKHKTILKNKEYKVFIVPVITSAGIILSIIALKLYSQMNPLFNNAILSQFPRFNTNFPTLIDGGYFFSATHTVLYYIYAYGFRLALYMGATFYLFKKDKKWGLLLIYCFIPVFICINTIQLSPLSVYDNHKWLKPFNLIMDLVIVTYLVYVIHRYKKFNARLWIFLIVVVATVSGLISFVTYMFQKPIMIYEKLNDPIIVRIEHTKENAVFLTDDSPKVFLAGRKTYVADYLGGDLGLKTKKREMILKHVLEMNNGKEMCRFLKKENALEVDYIYLKEKKVFIKCEK